MSDVFTKEKRSEVMSRIRGRGNRDTEIALAKLLRIGGMTGWRRHQAVFGKPDFVFRKLRLAIFVDGCFWHSCPTHATKPKNNTDFWETKLARNRARDTDVTRALRAKGWTVLRIWEHELTRSTQSKTLRRIRRTVELQKERTNGLTKDPVISSFGRREKKAELTNGKKSFNIFRVRQPRGVKSHLN